MYLFPFYKQYDSMQCGITCLQMICEYYNNVSSMNSEQSKLCINGPLYIDAWLLWEQAIGSNGP